MALSGFHPTVAAWFAEALGEPTPAQVQGWEAIRSRRHTLIAAPTGSGKTLAAFLNAIDDLVRRGLDAPLPAETTVVYVSPLKALSTDIHRNLALPLEGITAVGESNPRFRGRMPVIRTAVRTGDTPSSKRAAMLRTPPHILVTTPESLYLLLTAARSREMMRTVRTVIVDEIHAVLGSRRGSHLALTLERLQHVAGVPIQRIGLSATQRPIKTVARFLIGPDGTTADDEHLPCAIVDEGHRRDLDLAIELPGSALEAVMAHEVWEEQYDRLVDLIGAHRTTLVFVNTRRLAERLAHHLSDRLGSDAVTAHHGSLSREKRLDAERRLKDGSLRALVATASLELGIDIGHVDLVCQLGSTRRIATLLQRVGRSGHTVIGTPKGRLFPLSRDDLVECVALLRTVDRGELDQMPIPNCPRDVLAQQIVAETACEDWREDDLFELYRGAYPYQGLDRDTFDDVVRVVAQGFTTRRGRRGALVHYDAVNHRVRGRRHARLTAITAGGAIPDNADYRVVLEPEQTFLGTINEDFAIESMAGDVFQLGNASWRIVQVASGTVRVADARGEPPSIPFWFGEAPTRSPELSSAVSDLRREVDERLTAGAEHAVTHLTAIPGVPEPAARQIVDYLKDAKHLLGVIPTQETLVLERFFDESGGMQLVLHAPYGARVNRAWGLALRKRFCRQFNFELQAAATENGLLLSLGPQHSFPLDNVFRYLHADSVRDVLVQALLDAPMFQTRWRWNTTIALAVLRNRGGRKVPSPLQRMEAEDLLAAVFPDAAACLENIGGDREVPTHPLVAQTIDDCLDEAMDLSTLTRVLEAVWDGKLHCISRDTPEPSPLCHELLNAQPYAFLDDAPLEERRTQAVYTRRALEPSSANELGALDPAAIARVNIEAWPEVRDADELHDALLTAGFLTEDERTPDDDHWLAYFEDLVTAGRAQRVPHGDHAYWVATERRDEFDRARRDAADPETATRRDDAVRELLRGRMEIVGPVTGATLAQRFPQDLPAIETGLAALESEGMILRGTFSPGVTEQEWCNRRLLARIHRYTLNRLRAEIEPVTASDFMRFLFTWQKLDPDHRVTGLEGLYGVIRQLDGYEVAAGAWEPDVLGSRVTEYDPTLLDTLCLAGRVNWGRLSRPSRPGSGPYATGPIRSTRIALWVRDHTDAWLDLAAAGLDRLPTAESEPAMSAQASQVLRILRERGASFFQDIARASRLLNTHVEMALGELVALGLVSSDSFAGLRVLLTPSDRRSPPRGGRRRRGRTAPFGFESAGRWATTDTGHAMVAASGSSPSEGSVECQAWTLLRRYGVVFRRLLARETNLASWRELAMTYRRLEARGEIRGGRFVSGMSGEQFALPEAVAELRAVRRREKAGALFGISAADPLNLTGVITPGERVPALAGNRIVYADGVPVGAMVAGRFSPLTDLSPDRELDVEKAVVRRPISPALRAWMGRVG